MPDTDVLGNEPSRRYPLGLIALVVAILVAGGIAVSRRRDPDRAAAANASPTPQPAVLAPTGHVKLAIHAPSFVVAVEVRNVTDDDVFVLSLELLAAGEGLFSTGREVDRTDSIDMNDDRPFEIEENGALIPARSRAWLVVRAGVICPAPLATGLDVGLRVEARATSQTIPASQLGADRADIDVATAPRRTCR